METMVCDRCGRSARSRADEGRFVAGFLSTDEGGTALVELCPECHNAEQRIAADLSNPGSEGDS
jgi:hypothetical protein